MRRRKRRRLPPIWLAILMLLPFGGIVWLWFGDPGDEGMRNVGSMLLTLLLAILVYVWFVFFSANPGKLRAIVGVGVLLLIGAGVALVRVDGFSGSMVPELSPRFRDSGSGGATVPIEVLSSGSDGSGGDAGTVDLATETPDDFPGFLGAGRDGTVPGLRLARDWLADSPEVLWRRAVGTGWSGFAVRNGVAVTQEQRGEWQTVVAYDVATGEPLWSHTYRGEFEHFLGGVGPRATPTIHDGRVYALDARGKLLCLDGADGDLLWEKDLLADYGMTEELEFASVQYGRSNSPLVHGELVVVPAGGNPEVRQAGLVAFDARTGERVWEGPPRQVSFSSPRLATLAGLEQILIVNEDTVSGHDPGDGTLLWEHPWPGTTSANASVSQAVPVQPDRVFVSKGYGGGAALLRLSEEAGEGETALGAVPVWENRRSLRTKLTNVVVHEGHVYGLSDGILECVVLETGERVWREGRYGHGQILLIGDLLLVVTELGELVLVLPTPESEGRVLARFQAVEGKTWNNPALYGDVLFVRNASEAVALRLPRARR